MSQENETNNESNGHCANQQHKIAIISDNFIQHYDNRSSTK